MRAAIKSLACLAVLLSLSIGLCGYAQAQPPQSYQVEVIVFEHVSKQALAAEDWPTNVNLPNTRGAINLTTMTAGNTKPDDFERLPASLFTLTKEANAINKKAGFKVLLHLAWRQPISRRTRTIHLVGGEFYGRHDAFDDEQPTSDQNWQLNGTLSLNRTTFINLKTDLVLAIPTQQIPHSVLGDYQYPLMYFQLKQTRRIRSKELNYFDHPLLGMLIEIIPIKNEL